MRHLLPQMCLPQAHCGKLVHSSDELPTSPQSHQGFPKMASLMCSWVILIDCQQGWEQHCLRCMAKGNQEGALRWKACWSVHVRHWACPTKSRILQQAISIWNHHKNLVAFRNSHEFCHVEGVLLVAANMGLIRTIKKKMCKQCESTTWEKHVKK